MSEAEGTIQRAISGPFSTTGSFDAEQLDLLWQRCRLLFLTGMGIVAVAAVVDLLVPSADPVLASGDETLIADWRKLQTSDHFYYMCTKWFADGDVHKYFNPYESPYDAYINYMNILDNVRARTT